MSKPRTPDDEPTKKPEQLKARDPLDIANVKRKRTPGLLRINVKTFSVGVAERPPKTFIRAHTDPEFSLDVAIVPSDPEKDIEQPHIITNDDIADELESEGRARAAILTRILTRQGQNKLWIIKVPSEGAKVHIAQSTALQCLKTVREQWGWVRWQDLETGYVVEVPADGVVLPDPVWNDGDKSAAEVMQDMVRKGFREHVIDSRDHPVYQAVATGGIVG